MSEEPTPTHDPISAIPEPEAPQSEAPPPSPLYQTFIGRFGLRAGWGLALYVLLFALATWLVSLGLKHLHRAARGAGSSGPQVAWSIFLDEGITAALLLLVAWVMARIERRPFGSYGLGARHLFDRLLHGTVWGLAAMSLLVLLLSTFHLLTFDRQLDHGWAILGYGALLLLGFFLVGLAEEFLFRGYLQFTLTRGLVGLGNLISQGSGRTIAFWIAAVLTSSLFLFAHTHNSGENWIGLVSVFLAGVLFLVALWRTGSLWWAIGFHTAWDWAQSFLYGVPDSGLLVQGRLFATHPSGRVLLSGGTVGPEGSVLLIPVLALAIVVLLFTQPAPMPPLEPNYVPR